MSAILSTVSNIAGDLKLKGQNVLDNLFPPEKRAEMFSRIQAFVVQNPKVSAFLLTNFALTGLPLMLFAGFTLTVFVFSLVAALLVGLLVALLFTAFMVGVALLVILPTVFLTTMGASFMFLWGLGGYYIFKWFNNESGEGSSEGGGVSAIGDKLNNLTGGRIGFLMDDARKQQAKKETDGDESAEKNASSGKNGSPRTPRKLNANKTPDVGDAKDQVEKTVNVDGIKKRAGNATNTVNTATSAAGGAKGAVGGVTGLV